MVELFEIFPWWVILIDYVLGLVMWTLIGRAAMGFFLPETSTFFFMRFFVQVDRPCHPGIQADHAGVSDPADGAPLCRMVLLYGPLLPYAVASWLFGHGHAVLSIGKRSGGIYLQDFHASTVTIRIGVAALRPRFSFGRFIVRLIM